jgi:hypothetical protein
MSEKKRVTRQHGDKVLSVPTVFSCDLYGAPMLLCRVLSWPCRVTAFWLSYLLFQMFWFLFYLRLVFCCGFVVPMSLCVSSCTAP